MVSFRNQPICKNLNKDIPEEIEMSEQDKRIAKALKEEDFGCQHESIVKLTEAIIGHPLQENVGKESINLVNVPNFVLLHLEESSNFDEETLLVLGFSDDLEYIYFLSNTNEDFPSIWGIEFDNNEVFLPATEEQENEFFRDLKKKRL